MKMKSGNRNQFLLKLIGLITGLICLVDAKQVLSPSSNSDFDQENYLENDKFIPTFLTLGQKYSIAAGSTVVLPCKINKTINSDQFTLTWVKKEGSAVLTAANVKVTVNPRLRLMSVDENFDRIHDTKSYNLEINGVRKTDGGVYRCQIGSDPPREIAHTLEVLIPPKIEFNDPSTRVDIKSGSTVRLECRATGNPKPKIIWSRKNNLMYNGEPNITQDVLEIMHANRHSSGHYKCTADNRVGQTDSREIYVNVLHAPEIEVERPYVHTGVGFEAYLVCMVHAEPPPHVVWYKDEIQLGTTEFYSQQVQKNRYNLIIRNVTFSDFGNYTCQAGNKFGKDRATLKLTGIPSVCIFDSSTLSDYRDMYNVSWSVQSFSPIHEYRLFYIKQSLHHMNQESYQFATNSISFDQWENIVIPGTTMIDYNSYEFHNNYTRFHHHTKHRMSHLIRNLTPATNYIARIQARNEHGWNKLSSVFHFATRAEDLEFEPSAQPAVSKNIDSRLDAHSGSSSSKIMLMPVLVCILTTLIVIFEL